MNVHAPTWQRPVLEILYWVFVASCVLLGACAVLQHWWVLFVLAMIGLGVLLYGGFVEPRLVRVVRHRVASGGTKALRVVFLSDLHAGLKKGQAFYRSIAERTQALNPDLVILGGDLVDESTSAMVDLQPIVDLRPPLGRWFVLGNHDFFDDPNALVAWLERQGARNLTNQARIFSLGGEQSLELIGLDDSWFGAPDMSLLEAPKKGLRLLITHEPDSLLDLEEGAADLVLLGHTHGGQIRLPIYGAVTGMPQNAPQWLDAGEKVWRGMRVIISRGIAEAGVRARLGSRPEIVVIDLDTETRIR